MYFRLFKLFKFLSVWRQVLSEHDVYTESNKLKYLLKNETISLVICNDLQTTKYLKKN